MHGAGGRLRKGIHVEKTRTITRDLLVRRCVACGYDGALLDGGRARRCAQCGADLRSRPPRSYAEREGLTEGPDALDAPPSAAPRWDAEPRDETLIQNWLAFIFFVILGLLLLASLVAAALP
jgi:hypothetical protein